MKKITLAFILLATLTTSALAEGPDPVKLRFSSLGVLPVSLPFLTGEVQNCTDQAITATVELAAPETWKLHKNSLTLTLEPKARVPFAVKLESGRNASANAYPVTAKVTVSGKSYSFAQQVPVTSAPYYKVTADGKFDDWKESIPVSFTAKSGKTTLSTHWNRRTFSLLFAVEEEKLVRQGEAEAIDAVQFAIAPVEGKERFEYLVVATKEGAQAYQLVDPDTTPETIAQKRALKGLETDAVDVVVTRKEGVTYYECNVSFSKIRDYVRPTEGREFRLGYIVHDADKKDVRQWSVFMKKFDKKPNTFAHWLGETSATLYDGRTKWGMCSSRF